MASQMESETASWFQMASQMESQTASWFQMASQMESQKVSWLQMVLAAPHHRIPRTRSYEGETGLKHSLLSK